MIAGAGNETTARLIGFMGQLLGEHPDQRRELVADPSLIPSAVEETLRYEPPSPVQARYVAADVELYGQTVTEGSYMLLLNGSANRDETKFTDPDRYDIHRTGGHLSFGQGLHFCLGSALAGSRGGSRSKRSSSGGPIGTSTTTMRPERGRPACEAGRNCPSRLVEAPRGVARRQTRTHHLCFGRRLAAYRAVGESPEPSCRTGATRKRDSSQI